MSSIEREPGCDDDVDNVGPIVRALPQQQNSNREWLCELRGKSTYEGALICAAHGWAVLPCIGKNPLTTNGFHDASSDPDQITRWWEQYPDANIGWPLLPGWWALDVDPRNGGTESLRKLEHEHGPLPMTLRQLTGSGGEHWIFRVPNGINVRQISKFKPGLDTKVGGKGYLIVAPSVHPETKRHYQWISVAAPVEAPLWLLEMVRVKTSPRKPYTPPSQCHPRILDRRKRYALAVLVGEAKAVASSIQGERNERLNKAWWRLAQFKDVLTRAQAERELLAAALASGLSETEARKVLR